MSDNSEQEVELREKFKKMSLKDLNGTYVATKIIGNIISMIGISSILFALYFPMISVWIAAAGLCYLLGSVSHGLGVLRIELKEYIEKRQKTDK